MLSRINPAVERDLLTGFETGYANAVASFNKLTNENFNYKILCSGFFALDSQPFMESAVLNRKGSDLLLTTEVFGELTGKSYLLIPERDYAHLTKSIPEDESHSFSFKEEFAKELDNILSAAVITQLSNELRLKIYGDVPILVGKIAGDLKEIIIRDFGENTNEVFLTGISFSFDRNPDFNMRFIWVLNSHLLKAIASQVSK
jgi:hypothetical protein